MTWALRLLALVAAVVLLRWLWRWFWSVGVRRLLVRLADRMAPPSARFRRDEARRGLMKRDPVCGTFVDVEVSVKEETGSETLHFCSVRCRAAYRQQPARRAQAGR